MDKNAIKKYAVWARRELIARVTQKAEQYEITEKKITPANADSIGGRVLTPVEKKQRQALIAKVQQNGFEQVMEEVAYTWFNRFTALRFMEVNNYLPSHTRVFTNENNEFKPQILADAIQLELDGLNIEKVFELKDANKTEELYKYLLITQCNALSSILPRMFQKIADYTELLLPDYLLREGSVIEQMISMIPEEDWTDQVQIIGWLYQYYNTEPKDAVFAALKKNVKITKEKIPAATQLFTPDWIVRYMVENSLGRLWLEGHPDSKEQFLSTNEEQSAYIAGERNSEDGKWHYYLEEAEQEPDVQRQLDEIRREYSALKPEEIRCIDPCAGSGHILCYMFDVLVKIYEDYGYTAREAVGSIIEKNIWGLDIDERAAQLSYFAVMMKGCQYDRRFFYRKDRNGNPAIPQPNVYAVEESNGITSEPMQDMGADLSQEEYGEAIKQTMRLVEEMYDAKEYGSIIHVTPCDWNLLRRFAVPRRSSDGQMRMDIHGEIEVSERLQRLISIGEILSQKYSAVVTNPPYMSASGMSATLAKFVRRNYADSKADLFAVFIERCRQLVAENCYCALITQQSWMFLPSFEKLRSKLIDTVNMAHLGARAFDEIGGEIVQTTSFVNRNTRIRKYKGVYRRLIGANSQQKKKELFLSQGELYITSRDTFDLIPGASIGYWLNKHFISNFSFASLGENYIPKFGMSTGDGERFVRNWYEISIQDFCTSLKNAEEAEKQDIKWVAIDKGGTYRKWYGNRNCAVWWKNNGADIKNHPKSAVRSSHLFFKPHVSWTLISSGHFSARLFENGFALDTASNCIYSNIDEFDYVLALLNSCVADEYLSVLNPTMNFSCGVISLIPYLEEKKEDIIKISGENVEISKKDWDSFELSWDFHSHPLVPMADKCREQLKSVMNTKKKVVTFLSERYSAWERECEYWFSKIKKNEEKLNRLFIDIYGLQDELTPEVEDKDVTVRKADIQRDIRSLISYAVGCMFGRYSIYKPGLLFAGEPYSLQTFIDKLNDQPNVITQDQLIHEYRTNGIIINEMFEPDRDNIIPICDDEYFEDDIVGRFVEFIEMVYGKDTLEENLKFIADALGGKGSSREIIRNYFINDFYADHLKVYQKRPIYWLFDSGKKNGFKCLIYMHRYQPDTIARIRTDYVHEQQSRYRTAIEGLEQRINDASTSERVKLNKQLTKLQAQATEIREYEEKIRHLADQMISIDLDDGVKVNYAKFQDVLAKIK